jgi:hypothetical protein
MRTGLTLIGVAAAGLLAAGMIAVAPAHADSGEAYVTGGEGYQYILSCNSVSTCNTTTAGTMEIQFGRSGTNIQSALGIYYEIINGTAVDGTDFNTPATGEVIVPANQYVTDLIVPLVNERGSTSKTFTVEITGTTSPITLSPGSATNTILGGNVPLDCSFTYISGTSKSMTCTQRPATQVWSIMANCYASMTGFVGIPGSHVTGDGTSTLSSCNEMNGGLFWIDS